MAVDSYNSLIASAAGGKLQDAHFAKVISQNSLAGALSLWALPNTPAAGGSGPPLLSNACTSATAGALSFANPVAPDLLYLTSLWASANVATVGTLFLYDRIADIAGINLASANGTVIPLTSTAWPRYATGSAVQMFMEVTTGISGAPVVTLNYTNQAGAAGQVTPALTCAANIVDRFAYNSSLYIPLATGDSGVRAVASITIVTGGASGVGRLVLARQIATLPLINAGTAIDKDLVTQVTRLPRIFDNACLALFLLGGGTNTGNILGTLTAIAA